MKFKSGHFRPPMHGVVLPTRNCPHGQGCQVFGAASREKRSGKLPKVANFTIGPSRPEVATICVKKFLTIYKKKGRRSGQVSKTSYTFSIIIDFQTIDNRYKSILDPLPLPPRTPCYIHTAFEWPFYVRQIGSKNSPKTPNARKEIANKSPSRHRRFFGAKCTSQIAKSGNPAHGYTMDFKKTMITNFIQNFNIF